MFVTLTSDQLSELADRQHDVDRLVSILGMDNRHASREKAFLAWHEHSESSAASWLIIESKYEVISAYDTLIRRLVGDAVRQSSHSMAEGAVAEFISDYLAQSPADPEDPDIMTVFVNDVEVGKMREWSVNDHGLGQAIVERFDLDLPSDWTLIGRSSFLEPLGVSIKTANGLEA